MYCRIVEREVNSCDHSDCNDGSNQSQAGMKYCKIIKRYVYSCDHYECN